MNKAVVEVDVDFRVNAEETHDESEGYCCPSCSEVGTVLATMTVETPQEVVEVRKVLEQVVVEVDVHINAEETHDESDLTIT